MSKRFRECRPFLGYEMTRADQSAIASLIGHTCLAVGISKRKIKSEEALWHVVEAMFGMRRKDGEEFVVAVRRIRNAIARLPPEERQAKRHAAIGKLNVPEVKLRVVSPRPSGPQPQAIAPPKKREEFYLSWEWRRARMKIIKAFDRRCMCCGASPDDQMVGGGKVRLIVDHIKPLSKHWALRLDPTNLQVLCDECNMGKGAWDETDHRSESERLIAEQLRYEIDASPTAIRGAIA